MALNLLVKESLLTSLNKGGKGSGWFGPPSGTHVGQEGSSTPSGSGGVTAEMLSSRPLINIGEQEYEKGAFESEKVHVEGDGDAILKPEPADEHIMRSISLRDSDYSFANREALAYEVSEELGFSGLVPITTVRLGDPPASIQQWVDNAVIGWDSSPSDWRGISEDNIKQLQIFDALTGNTDRHAGNYLIKDKKLIGIDHGLAFSDKSDISKYLKSTGYENPITSWESSNNRKLQWRKADFASVARFQDSDAFYNISPRISANHMLMLDNRIIDLINFANNLSE